MRVLLLNPNTTHAVTERLVDAASAVKAPGTTIVPVTATRGVPYISTRAEAQIGGAIALEIMAEHHDQVDCAIIAAFGDPALLGARELFDIPVVGMAEAAMLASCMLGRRFSIVTFAVDLEPWYEECVAMHGLSGRCASIRALANPFESLAEVQSENENLLVELARDVVEIDGADVVILAGAPLAGLARRVAHRIPVPVVDQIEASIKQAEMLVSLGPRKAARGTFRRPAAKSSLGLTDALSKRLAHAD